MSHIGRYSVVRKLATGGMAEVYLARIEGLADFRKRVVVKRILPQLAKVPEFVEMFLKEARLAALLDHPNLVGVFDLALEGGTYHLAMEYVEGTSLLALIQAAQARRELLPIDRAVWIVMQVLEGLSYAHRMTDEAGKPLDLIHRDVSPENVLLGRAGTVKLADFGLAKAANHPRVTQTGAFKGKLHYLAPEMVRTSSFDLRVDLFSAGVVLFEALTNVKPFAGPTPNDVLDAVLHNPAPPLSALRPSVPPAVQLIIDRALSKDPAGRYPTARAMWIDLDKLLADLNARPGPAQLAELITYLHPSAAASGNEPTLTPEPITDTYKPPRPLAMSNPKVLVPVPMATANEPTHPSPFERPPTKPPIRPDTPVSGSATVRGAPAFDPGQPGTDRTVIRTAPTSPSNARPSSVKAAPPPAPEARTELYMPKPAAPPGPPDPKPPSGATRKR